jgi:ATP adenylyltransferase
MSRLWAPWRIKYLKEKNKKSCIFCRAAKSPRKNFVVYQGAHSLALLNLYPYNNGHLMVCPLRHKAGIEDLSEKEILDLFFSLKQAKAMLDKVLKPHGYNIGMNTSPSAGAGFPKHMHLHIVPRWRGDTNFMPVISGTKVISQSLKELYGLLKKCRKRKY